MTPEELRESVREAVGLTKPGVGKIFYPEDIDAVIRVVLEAAAWRADNLDSDPDRATEAAVSMGADPADVAASMHGEDIAAAIRALIPATEQGDGK